MIHGLTPGPIMFFQNTDIIYTLFAGLMLSSVFLLAIGYGAIKVFKYIAHVPKTILMPCVLVLCVYGGYAVNNSVFDVGVMFLMGGLGFMMYRFNIPPAPFVIAFILGPLFEDNFRQAMLMSGGDFAILLRSPITWFFWLATLVTLVALTGIWRRATNLLRKG